jgi:hypothetical protein
MKEMPHDPGTIDAHTHSERAVTGCRQPRHTVVATVVLTFTHQFTHPSNKTRSSCHHFMLVNKIIILELVRAHLGLSEKSTRR